MRIYYAHCMAIYSTPQEKRDVQLLKDLGFTVLNPNQKKHSKACIKNKGGGMEYFHRLINDCDAVAFRALPSMEIPSGVHSEIMYARNRNMPIIELPGRMINRGMTLADTREYLHECGER